MTNLPEKSRLADLLATGDYSLRELLLIEYHNVIATRQRGTSWSKIAAALGRHPEVVRRGWSQLEALIKAGKIVAPPPPLIPGTVSPPPVYFAPDRTPALAPDHIAKSDNPLRDLVLAKMAESESTPNGKPMLAGRSLDPADYDDDDMSGAALRARDYAARLLKNKP